VGNAADAIHHRAPGKANNVEPPGTLNSEWQVIGPACERLHPSFRRRHDPFLAHSRANSAHFNSRRPESGLGFRVNAFKVPFSPVSVMYWGVIIAIFLAMLTV
jgi:hypothetical protein